SQFLRVPAISAPRIRPARSAPPPHAISAPTHPPRAISRPHNAAPRGAPPFPPLASPRPRPAPGGARPAPAPAIASTSRAAVPKIVLLSKTWEALRVPSPQRLERRQRRLQLQLPVRRHLARREPE